MILTNEGTWFLEECSRPDTNGVESYKMSCQVVSEKCSILDQKEERTRLYVSVSHKCRGLVPGRVSSIRYIIGYSCKAVMLEVGTASVYYTNQNGGGCLSTDNNSLCLILLA